MLEFYNQHPVAAWIAFLFLVDAISRIGNRRG